jgi:nicotinic acid mononucleotide adenylyltransferase
MENKESKFGVFVGRFSPAHLGHEAVIGNMINNCGIGNCLVVLGSSNAPMSFRHLFSYEDRRRFLRKNYPDLQIVGLPDYPTNEEWLLALDDILALRGIESKQTIFFGGCEEDIHFFVENERRCQLLNRFDGTTPKVSATEVRDALIQGRSLEGLINGRIINDVKNCFTVKWDTFRKM